MSFLDKTISLKPMLFVQITLVVILASMGTAFAVIAPDEYDNTVDTPAIQTYTEDTGVEIVQGTISPQATEVLVADLTGELDPTTYDTVTTTVTEGDYIYVFDFQETAVNSVSAVSTYTIKVWADGLLKAEFTIDQATVEAADVEGVTCTVSCGATGYPDAIEIHATKN
ncbi:MAG: hypothetical protein SVY53_00845 [Chloroflexota bacterium]|nr:hypothetical protein [Chloroflexota bacterium]